MKKSLIGKESCHPLLFLEEILLFLSFAGILAKQIGAKHIVTGVCETDLAVILIAGISLLNR